MRVSSLIEGDVVITDGERVRVVTAHEDGFVLVCSTTGEEWATNSASCEILMGAPVEHDFDLTEGLRILDAEAAAQPRETPQAQRARLRLHRDICSQFYAGNRC